MAFAFETLFQDGIMSILGDPTFAGVAVIAFFAAFTFLMPTHSGIKIIAIFGGVILSLPFLGWGLMLLSFGLGIIIWFAIKKFWG